jgi:hypothetical protein
MVLDFVGKQITPGCRIAYPMRRGSKMWLSSMTVTGIVEEPGGTVTIVGYASDGRRTHTKNVQTCVVLP